MIFECVLFSNDTINDPDLCVIFKHQTFAHVYNTFIKVVCNIGRGEIWDNPAVLHEFNYTLLSRLREAVIVVQPNNPDREFRGCLPAAGLHNIGPNSVLPCCDFRVCVEVRSALAR